jgi:hypothetical protein
MPVVTVAPNDALLEKLKSNMHEVRARGGVLYVLADADSQIRSSEGVHVIRMPEHYGVLSPILQRRTPATAGLPHGLRTGHRCGQAAQFGEVGDGGIVSLGGNWRATRGP